VANGQDGQVNPIKDHSRIVLAMRPALTVAFAIAALGLVGCGSDSDEEAATGTGASSGGQVIEIDESEFALDPANVQVDETGTVTFRVSNQGSLPHALEVDGEGIEEETETIEPGQTAELTVDLSREGSYELYCPIGDHRDQGMEGELIVGSAGAGTVTGGGTGTMDDEDDGSTTGDDGTGY
jgi:plastocyanin